MTNSSGSNSGTDTLGMLGVLPAEVLLKILSLLPFITLIRFRLVCSKLREILDSPDFRGIIKERHDRRHDDDIFFFLFCNHATYEAAIYHPASDRIFYRRLHHGFPFPFTSAASSFSADLIAVLHDSNVDVFSLLSNSPKQNHGRLFDIGYLPDSIPNVLAILAFTEEPSAIMYDYHILVATSQDDRVYGRLRMAGIKYWRPVNCTRDGAGYVTFTSAAYARGRLYVIGCGGPGPGGKRLLELDTEPCRWKLLNVATPRHAWPLHLFSFENELFLLAGARRHRKAVISTIVVWKMDWENKKWTEISTMPEELFADFAVFAGGFFVFNVVSRKGMVCLCNNFCRGVARLAKFDAATMLWQKAARLPWLVKTHWRWFGHAAEPDINLFLHQPRIG